MADDYEADSLYGHIVDKDLTKMFTTKELYMI